MFHINFLETSKFIKNLLRNLPSNEKYSWYALSIAPQIELLHGKFIQSSPDNGMQIEITRKNKKIKNT